MDRKRMEESRAATPYAPTDKELPMDAYHSILVHMDASPRCAVRLALARQLAREHDGAALLAMLALEPRAVPEPVPLAMDIGVPAVRSEVDPDHRRRARKTFELAMGSGDPAMTWVELPPVPPVWGMVQASHYVDLMVLGQRDPEDALTADVPRDFVESVAMESGKPALVIPYAGRFDSIGRNVLIAWKPTRECARAVEAALPLLQRASRVHAVSWGEDSFGPAETTFGIVRALRWHGVECTAHRYAEEPESLGDLLLSKAATEGSDLLVMGCYGHHRLRELLLGGTTRTILRSMTLPVLLAH
jgi:nucleotide-binding universal stress UspA family protein